MIKTRLIHLLRHARRYVVGQVVLQWIALLAEIAIMTIAADLLQEAYTRTLRTTQMISAAGLVCLLVFLRFFLEYANGRMSFLASADVKRILRNRIYDKLLRLGASYRERVTSSTITQMASEGVEQLEIYFGRYLSQFFYALLAPLTLFAFLVRVSHKAALVLLLAVPLIPIVIMIVMKAARKRLDGYFKIYYGLGDTFLEKLQGMSTLKIYQADETAAQEMDEESERFRRVTMKVLSMQLNSTTIMDIVAYGGAAVGMVVAVDQFLAGQVNLSGTLLIVLLSAEFFLPMRALGSFFHIGMNGMKASDHIFAFLDLPEPAMGQEEIDHFSFPIVFRNVHFAYEEGHDILKGVDLSFPTRSFTSIVGVSGSGKSTIASVLMGRNKGYRGMVTVDEKELSTIREASLMSHITLISHHSFLFKGTVRDNLAMGNPEADEKEMEDVLRKVNLLGFVQNEGGLDMQIKAQGENLSGGQRQRLALARALLHDTSVYIFDEATSNIDMESEAMIMAVIHQLAKQKTVILISHRLANVVDSDRIYMLKDGRVVEQGRHDQLLKSHGPYETLYRSQKELEAYADLRKQVKV